LPRPVSATSVTSDRRPAIRHSVALAIASALVIGDRVFVIDCGRG
jgi:hypothetical protein